MNWTDFSIGSTRVFNNIIVETLNERLEHAIVGSWKVTVTGVDDQSSGDVGSDEH
jgi:hypothetical protein